MNRIIKAMICTGVLALPQAANAAIPTTDAANVLEVIKGNIQAANIAMQQKSIDIAKMELRSMLTGQNVDAMNNGIANMITRTTMAATDIYNLNLFKESKSAVSACETAAVQSLDAEYSCVSQDDLITNIAQHASKHNTFGMSPAQQDRIKKEAINENFELCQELAVESTEGGGLGTLCTNAGTLFGTTVGPTRDKDTQQAADQFVNLIAGVAPANKASVRELEGMSASQIASLTGAQLKSILTPETIARITRERRGEALRSLVILSLESINSMYKNPEGDDNSPMPSEMHRLHKFVDDRWGNAKWMRKVNNSPRSYEAPGGEADWVDEADAMMEPQLIRELVAMEAFQVNLNLMSYEQQLLDTALQAAMLSIAVDG